MKLYAAPYAPNPRRVAMFMAEKHFADIEVVTLDLTKGEHRERDFRQKSPLAQVPALELDDGRTLTESRAICSYLESVRPEPNLMGADAFERAQIEMWDRRAELLLSMPLMLWVRHASPFLAGIERQQTAAVAEYYRAQAMRLAAWFDNELASQPWIAGARFTIADITLACGMDFAKMMRWRPGDDLPNLRAWRARFSDRPAGQVPA